MVWIYGGGFLEGVSSVFNASAIIAQSVLRVSPIMLVPLLFGVPLNMSYAGNTSRLCQLELSRGPVRLSSGHRGGHTRGSEPWAEGSADWPAMGQEPHQRIRW